MYLTRLAPGTRAAGGADQLHFRQLPNGRISWTGSVESNGTHVFKSSRIAHRSMADAEAEAIAWAESYGISDLQIEADD